MKKISAILLCVMMIFAIAIPVFAGSADDAVKAAKLELGADINSTSGTEPSVKRSADEPADVTRGAGFILAADAVQRSDDFLLEGSVRMLRRLVRLQGLAQHRPLPQGHLAVQFQV